MRSRTPRWGYGGGGNDAEEFGRVAAQTARQVIQQRIREASAITARFTPTTGEILNGVVQAASAQGVTLGLEMKAEGIMPRNQHDPGRALPGA